MGMSETAALDLLVVEDNPADLRLLREALRESPRDLRCREVRDGLEAMEALAQPAADLPRVVLLDLNLPRMDGREVLARMKGDPLLRRIPVVVLSSSSEARDVRGAYELHANAYLVKPSDFGAFRQLVRTFEEFWLESARLP